MIHPKISIIIPIYKVEQYLCECLESCINQTYKNIEIIAVNDGSPDGCGDIIDRYAALDHRISHVKKENGGLPKARETGILASTGDYILHLDGDDFIPTNAAEVYAKKIEEESSDVVLSDYFRYYTDGTSEICTEPIPDGSIINGIVDYFQRELRVGIWGRVIRRELCLDCVPQSITMGEDTFTILQIYRKCKKISYTKTALYYYRLNDASTMSRPDAVKWEIEHKLILTDFLTEHDFPTSIIQYMMLSNAGIICKYCTDYNNPITRSKREDVKRLTAITLKLYPNLLKESLSRHSFKRALICNIIHYCPSMAKVICFYDKIIGNKIAN